MAENNGNFFKGLFIGGLIGATIGILYAPKSGKESREELIGKADELLSRAKEEYEKNKEDYEVVFKQIKDMGSSIKGKASETKGKISKFSHSSKKNVQDKKERLKKAINAGVAAYREKQKKKRV